MRETQELSSHRALKTRIPVFSRRVITRIAVNQRKLVLFPTDSWCFEAGIPDSVDSREPYAAPLGVHDHLIFNLRPSPTRPVYHSLHAPHPQVVFGLLTTSIASQRINKFAPEKRGPVSESSQSFSADRRCRKSDRLRPPDLLGG